MVAIATSAFSTSSWAQAGAQPLDPPEVESFRLKAPQPQWDAGVTLGAGIFERNGRLDQGAFLLGLEFDSLYLRRRESELGLGLALKVGTASFWDSRFALGPLVVLELFDPLMVEVAARGLLLADGQGISPGVNPELRLGLRSLNLKGHYSHAHLLALGADLSFPTQEDDPRARTTLFVTLRLDSMWFVAPVAAIFR